MAHLPVRIAGGLMFILLMLLLPAWICAQEKGDPRRLLTVWAGMLPIILSAPHGGREAIPGVGPRRGVGGGEFISCRNSTTAELAEKIGAKVEQTFHARPFLVVARFERKYLDANRPRHAA